MTIGIGGDHAGYEYKQAIIKSLEKKGINVTDHGPFSADSVDYPDFVHPAMKDLINGKSSLAILICGSGNGVTMTANKYQDIRAALCWKVELAKLARQHNNANVLCIPARFVSLRMAKMMVSVFLKTEFEGGRHARRVDKISSCQ